MDHSVLSLNSQKNFGARRDPWWSLRFTDINRQTGVQGFGQNQMSLSPFPLNAGSQASAPVLRKRQISDPGHLPLQFSRVLSLPLPVWTLQCTPSPSCPHDPSSLINLTTPRFSSDLKFKGFVELPVAIIASHTVFPQPCEQYRPGYFWVKTLCPVCRGSHWEVFDEDRLLVGGQSFPDTGLMFLSVTLSFWFFILFCVGTTQRKKKNIH